ncbi:MAG: hypothetical protein ACRDJI_08335 [Actinomycetota bacterium]
MKVAVVCCDPALRLAAARAFDGAPATWDVTLCEAPPEEADVVVRGPNAAPDVAGGNAGIAFDPTRPELLVPQIEATIGRGGRPHVMVVTSAAGGTGTTTIALHLAHALSAAAETCYLELTGGGAAARLAMPPDGLTWQDAGSTQPQLRLAAVPVAGGFRVLLAPPVLNESEALVVLDRAAQAYERLVVDVSAAGLPTAVLPRAHAGVIVMAPTRPCARRTQKLLERLPDLPWAIVSNRTGPGGETTRAGLERILGRRIALELPCTSALRDGEDDGRLLTGRWSRFSRGVARLAGALETL